MIRFLRLFYDIVKFFVGCIFILSVLKNCNLHEEITNISETIKSQYEYVAAHNFTILKIFKRQRRATDHDAVDERHDLDIFELRKQVYFWNLWHFFTPTRIIQKEMNKEKFAVKIKDEYNSFLVQNEENGYVITGSNSLSLQLDFDYAEHFIRLLNGKKLF